MARLMSKAAFLFLALTLSVSQASSQRKDFAGPPLIDSLGAHSNAGRGCVSCHAPHNDGAAALWGSTAGPTYGQKMRFGESEKSVEIQPANFLTEASEVDGVVLCLSCHDGNLTPMNMSASRPYEQKIGLDRSPVRPPTLRGEELAGNAAIDHPLGVEAQIELGNGLTFENGVFSVIPGTPYAQFVANYGWPTLAPRARSNPYGIDRQGRPYLVCTTCHNQHAMNQYVSRPNSPIAGNQGSQSYPTFFFVNGPYNPNVSSIDGHTSSSSVQFCRQCHFSLANESNNSNNIPTKF